MKLIGMSGKAGSGKSTIAGALVQSFREDGAKAELLSFATPLKLMIQSLFDYAEPEDARAAWRWAESKERPSKTLGGRTPRHALQTLGTEWGRDLIHPDLWVSLAKARAAQVERGGTDVVVFDDVRFPNEVEWITQAGGAVVHVSRPQDSFSLPGPVKGHVSETQALPHTLRIRNAMWPPMAIARSIRLSLGL